MNQLREEFQQNPPLAGSYQPRKGKYLMFIYSEKATVFFEISTVDLSYVVTVKSTVEISQNFVAYSEYMTFIRFLLSYNA